MLVLKRMRGILSSVCSYRVPPILLGAAAESPQGPIATYAFIRSESDQVQAKIQANRPFVAELEHYSTNFIERRMFEPMGITANQDEHNRVEPTHDPGCWSWELTTKGAALVIDKEKQSWRFMSSSAVVAADVGHHWVVHAPVKVKVLLGTEFYLSFSPNPGEPDPASLSGAKLRIPWDVTLDDAIFDTYEGLSDPSSPTPGS
ncbi:hypothetical protein F5880DRAFT_1618277 [Lentinula raphanica]|nr:hypothetical protein F5880DRAFT_1618277 [Lentinula raphanica]